MGVVQRFDVDLPSVLEAEMKNITGAHAWVKALKIDGPLILYFRLPRKECRLTPKMWVYDLCVCVYIHTCIYIYT